MIRSIGEQQHWVRQNDIVLSKTKEDTGTSTKAQSQKAGMRRSRTPTM